MIKCNYICVIIILALIIFIPFFLRSSDVPFFGGDPYYYLSHLQDDTPLQVHSLPTSLVPILFSVLPSSIFFLKLIMFLITVFCGIVMYKIIFNLLGASKLNGYITVGLMYSLLWFNWIFLKFENDLFGFMFVMVSLYFLVKYITRYRYTKFKIFDLNIILSLLFLFAGCSVWGFAIYFFVLFLLMSRHILYFISSVGVIILFHTKFIERIIPTFVIAENVPFIGLIISVLLIFLYRKQYCIIWNILSVVVGTALVILNLKMIYILVPVLLLNVAKIDFTTIIGHKLKNYIISLIIVLLFLSAFLVTINFPTHSDYELFRVAQTSDDFNDKSVYYSWSTGYFVRWHGVDQNHFGSPPIDEQQYFIGYVYAVLNDAHQKDCALIKKAKNTGIYYCG